MLTASLTLAFVVTLAVMFVLLVVPLRDFPMGHIMNMSLGQKIIYTFHLYLNTMNGSFPYIKMFHRDTGAVSLVNGIEVGITLAALLWVSVSRLLRINGPAATDHDVKMGFCFTVCFMLLLMVVLTPQARNSYHVMVLWPLPHLLFLLSMAVFSRHVSIKCARICLFVLVSCVISSQLVVSNRYLSALSQPGGYIDVSWSPAIYRLADYVNRHSGKYDEIVSVEAFNTQLLSFAADDGVRMKLHQEAWAILTNDESLKKMRDYILPGFKRGEKANLRWLYNAYFRNKKVLVITLAGGVYPAEVNFFRFARDYRLNLDQVAAINDAGGRTIYRLYAASTQREESLPQL